MKNIIAKITDTINHIQALHNVFSDESSFAPNEKVDFERYKENEIELDKALSEIGFEEQLYGEKGRQMILADFIEYVFLGRIYYAMQTDKEKDKRAFITAILHFVNMLMCYEAMTVSSQLRRKYLERLETEVTDIGREKSFSKLQAFEGSVGLKRDESDASKKPDTQELDKYFDSLLPKTAGGLWHELLVYIFLLRSDCGYIIPLLLSQRLMGLHDHIVPPDFLILTYDKRLYGIEVGTKKEIQSGSFSLKTAIPTATIDTINSRTSDRCPICKKWITFCPHIIRNYSDISVEIRKPEHRCLSECSIYTPDNIAAGKCPHTKYSRPRIKQDHTKHPFANNLHYHYVCVLREVTEEMRKKIIDARDKTALKTHYPYYSGLEELMKAKGQGPNAYAEQQDAAQQEESDDNQTLST